MLNQFQEPELYTSTVLRTLSKAAPAVSEKEISQREVNIEGLKTTLQLYAEHSQSKKPVPNPLKYVDQSYLKEALKKLGISG